MSATIGLKHTRTTTKLALSALFTLFAVIFMTITYTDSIDISNRNEAQNVKLNELGTLVSTIRSNIQWAGFYEKDLLLERTLGKGLASASSNDKSEINLYRLRVRLDNAGAAVAKLNDYLRSADDRDITTDLQLVLHDQLLRLESYEQQAPEQFKPLGELITQANATLRQGNPRALQPDFAHLAERLQIHRSAMRDLTPSLFAVELLLQQLDELIIDYKSSDEAANAVAIQDNLNYFYIALALVLVALSLNAIIFNIGILHPVEALMRTIQKVRSGDDSARSQLKRRDELGQLGNVLDELLDEKNRSLVEKETQSSILNASVINLIKNVFQLSQRDLSVRVPVAEDVTGAVSDSINQLAESIETTLKEVIAVAQQVNATSVKIRSQTDTVRSHTSRERQEISQALQELESVIKAMQLIAKLATVSHTSSKQAITASENAMHSVSETVVSINKIRQTIHEAEKRIKRLGERSQEIGGIVSLINNISERTHILSLNASMHAASAGEAGRGLMVVVDEVQRLAESSREATAEIETLVSNIQLETNDTIQVMNTVITDVVDGTRLAEEAGARMDETRATTNSLVESVVRIAQSAVSQARIAEQLRERANTIDQSTGITTEEMVRQSELSEQLVQAAAELQESVGVFKLTAA